MWNVDIRDNCYRNSSSHSSVSRRSYSHSSYQLLLVVRIQSRFKYRSIWTSLFLFMYFTRMILNRCDLWCVKMRTGKFSTWLLYNNLRTETCHWHLQLTRSFWWSCGRRYPNAKFTHVRSKCTFSSIWIWRQDYNLAFLHREIDSAKVLDVGQNSKIALRSSYDHSNSG